MGPYNRCLSAYRRAFRGRNADGDFDAYPIILVDGIKPDADTFPGSADMIVDPQGGGSRGTIRGRLGDGADDRSGVHSDARWPLADTAVHRPGRSDSCAGG